tara:strand:+ start:513 stop:1007 length:495 start_codon:yes stop_codon:yes gene_type:complete
MKKLLLILLVLLGLQIQAQVYFCDSINYTIQSAQSGPTTTILMLNGIANIPGTVTSWDWQACDANLCYSASGQSVTFNQFNVTDTIKVCLTTILDINMTIYTCMQCDSLVYGLGGWMKMGVLTSIRELIGGQMGGQMYDLLGREIFEIPKGTIYIKNGNKFIKQ